MMWYIFILALLSLSHQQVTFPDEDVKFPDEDVKFPDDFLLSKGGSHQLLNRRPVPQQGNIVFPVTEVKREQEIPCQTRSGQRGLCRPVVKCPVTIDDGFRSFDTSECTLSSDGRRPGICCPIKILQDVAPQGRPLRKPPPPPIVFPGPVSEETVNNAIQFGIQKVREKEQIEQQLVDMNIIIFPKEPAFQHQKFFQVKQETLNKGKDAEVNVQASTHVKDMLVLTPDQSTFGLPNVALLNTALEGTCSSGIQCFRFAKYRSQDGSCNNLGRADWGKAKTAFQRILEPAYDDGISTPRELDSTKRFQLRSTRVISTVLGADVDLPYSTITLMVMQWGQFLDHDIVHTPIEKGQGNTGIACCSAGQHLEANLRHPACFAIDIPANDEFYSKFNQRCMEFVRSLPAPRPECNLGAKEQMNQITAFIDGSNVYGSDEERNRNLRAAGGKLKVQPFGKGLLPEAVRADGECVENGRPRKCFVAGDVRANEQVELTVMHTLWVREHNRLVNILKQRNPNWSDDTLYEEARRIVIAEMQHITYNEFLPLFLGEKYVKTFGLRPRQRGHTNFYNPNINPQITNAFATAAYRFGHTLIQGFVNAVSAFGKVTAQFALSKLQFSPFLIYEPGFFDAFVRGLTDQPAQQFDGHFTSQVREKLFQGAGGFGMDLVALNIQRGRDHGLPNYNEWREVCKLGKVRNFNGLRGIMRNETIARLRTVYDSVDDMDLFAAGVGEIPLDGALLGPTFVCLVGDQFARLRLGDRFYYEEGGQAGSFTEAQLNEIRKVSLSRILCDNADALGSIQPLAFRTANAPGNRKIPCNSDGILRMDMTPWTGATSRI